MEKKLRKNQLRLLPNYFKKTGLIVFVLTCITLIILKLSGIEYTQTQKEIHKFIVMNFTNLSLLFVAFSRDKIEDELVIEIRLKAMAIAFIFAVGYSIFNPIIYLIFQEPMNELSNQQLIGSALLFYLFCFYLLKRSR
jgi:ATP/ADP translocase